MRLDFDLEGDLTEGEVDTLLTLTERYCVVLQTLRSSPQVTASMHAA